MGYPFHNVTDYLLTHACAGIRYQVYRDMLGASPDAPEMVALQREVLQQPHVKKHLAAQHPDGWFGHELHGIDGMDGHVGGLIRKGVEPDDPHIQRAAEALMNDEIAAGHKNWFRGGDALDDDGRGGNRAIAAQILAWAKVREDTPLLRDEITRSLEHMRAAMDYRSADDFSVKGKSRRYYRPMAKFPGANHIALLACTQSWRTQENQKMVRAAAGHAYSLMKDLDESITFRKPARFGGGFVGPFNYDWKALKPTDEAMLCQIVDDPYPFRFGFWLSEVTGVPDWARQSMSAYELLADWLERDQFPERLPEKTLQAFRKIMGREPNWRKKEAVKCDVTFAVLRACWPAWQQAK